MYTQITVYCPRCRGHDIKKNGFDDNQKQRYACKDCTRRFIGDHHLTYKGCHSQSDELIWEMTARGNGIRDICSITGYSKDKVQAALQRSKHEIKPTQKHYDVLQFNEFHIVGHKKNKVWLIYAYHQKTGQIVAFIWGKRDLKTAFDTVFADTNERWVGKQHTQAIEGNNCAIRHRISRAVHKSCCFSNSLFYHIKVFNIGFAYINACHWRKRQKNRI